MEKRGLQRLRGQVENVTYRKEDTGFVVLELDSGEELVTVVGVLPGVAAGEVLDMMGKWDFHAVFGRQFRVEKCSRSFVADTSSMLKYLSAGELKGIGSSMAYKIVEKFGADTFRVLEENPEELATIRGISKNKAREISDEFQRKFSMRETIIALGALGLSPDECIRAYHLYGKNAKDDVFQNPYLLCNEGIGVSFERADALADAMEVRPAPVCRTRAGIVYVMQHNLINGHSCIPKDKIVTPAANLLNTPQEDVQAALDTLVEDKSLIGYALDGRDFLFLPEYFDAESAAANRIKMMLRFPPAAMPALSEEIDAVEQESGIHYGEKQRLAISTAVEKGLLILTGGPGTGKTTTVNGILRLFERQGLSVQLAAPTGRAAKRMSELTGHEAKTIHRLLEVEWGEEGRQTFVHDMRNPIHTDAVIVDELSMVDISLFSSLLVALPLGCRLIMVGDADQLPPVGAGNVLSDLIQSDVLPVVELTQVFRQALQSLIVTNAHKIVRGEMPDISQVDNDFFFMKRLNVSQASDTVITLCARRLPAAYKYSPMTDIQVICPSRVGKLGTMQLNARLQEVLNPPDGVKKELKIYGRILREGDKVMQMKNNYNILYKKKETQGNDPDGMGVFNGDIGTLESINMATGMMIVCFEDKMAYYPLESAGELDLAYAVTVHKSQGCEFDAVILPVLDVIPNLSYRNLLYTAVTRAKRHMVLVGAQEQIQKMVDNNKRSRRYSALKNFLAEQGDVFED